jgi:hypothetical protein
MKIAVFWDAAPCSLVEAYRCLRGSCCLHHRIITYMASNLTGGIKSRHNDSVKACDNGDSLYQYCVRHCLKFVSYT